METKAITSEALKTILFGHVGQIQFILAPTEVKLRKRDLPTLASLGITKLYKVIDGYREGVVGGRYQDAVRAEEAMQGLEVGFESAGAPRGRQFKEGSVSVMESTDKEVDYIGLRLLSSDKTYYINQDNQIIDKSAIEFALPSRSSNSRQVQDKKVIWMTPKVKNFREVIINNTCFKVVK